MEPCENKILVEFIERFIKYDKFNLFFKYSRWFSSRCRKPRLPLNPEDLLLKVLEDFYFNKRKYYINSYSRFRSSVYYAMDSEIKKLFDIRKKNCLTEDSYENYLIPNAALNEYFDAELIMDLNGNNNFEKNELINTIRTKLIKKNYSDELKVFNEILKGGKRKEIADALKISANEVTAIQKRILRKIRKNF